MSHEKIRPRLLDIDDAVPRKRKDYEEFVSSTADIFSIAMVGNYDDFSAERCGFAAKFTHQIFETDKIYGYKNLSVLIMFALGDFQVFPRITASKVVPEDMGKPDDIRGQFEKFMELPVCHSEAEFRQVLAKQSAFRPFGRRVAEYEKRSGTLVQTFEVYNVTEMSPAFADYIRRVQFAAMFFIESLNYTPSTDKRWEYYILYEKFNKSGEICYATLGYCAIYNFYMFPEYLKPRIAQFMIMPQYQLCSHGKRLLQEVLLQIASKKSVWFSTVECPNAAFQYIHDFVEASNCSYLASYAPDRLRNGFSDEMKEEAFSVFKMNKERAKRAYEILRLVDIKRGDRDEYNRFTKELKKGIYAKLRCKTLDRVSDGELCRPSDEEGSGSEEEVDQPADERSIVKAKYCELLRGYLCVVAQLKRNERPLPAPWVLKTKQNGNAS
uniref:Histone acetyltransferase type B catalytic subunit n=1 Tax=Trichuris muris TaxID=70415 RepID=A0A5S6QCP9_TRIMR